MTERIQIELRAAPIALSPREPLPGEGAACTFMGTTRAEEHPEHGPLEALEYEAHEAMAMTQLESLAEEILEEFEIDSLRVVHAVGRVAVGAPSVLIEATSGHRDAAFLACRAMIDRLKQRVPIFKIECWVGGRSRPEGITPQPAPPRSDLRGD